MSALNALYASKSSELASLDGGEDTYGFRRALLESEMKDLAAENFMNGGGYGDLSQGDGSSLFPRVDAEALSNQGHNISSSAIGQKRPLSRDSALPFLTGFSKYANTFQNDFDGHFASDGLVMGQENGQMMPGAWEPDFHYEVPKMTTAPAFQKESFRSHSPSVSGSEVSFAASRKRQLPSLSLDDDDVICPIKSQRTSPSPLVTAETTPTSLESFDVPEGLFAFLGEDAKESMQEMLKEQRAQEKLAKRRQESLVKDEEMAFAMQQNFDTHHWPQMPSSRGSGASAGPSSQAIFDPNGRFQRPSCQLSPPSPFFSGPFVGPTTNTSFGSRAAGPSKAIKTGLAHRGGFSSAQNTYQSFQPSIKEEKEKISQPPNVEIIDLESDSDDPPATVDTGRDSANPIKLDSDDWMEVEPANLPLQSANNALANQSSNYSVASAASGFAGGASNFSQTIYNTATDMLESCQNFPGADSSKVYGANSAVYSQYPSLFDNAFSAAAFAQDTFSRHGMDVSTNTEAYHDYINRIDYVTNDPTRTKAEIQSLLENIRPDEDLPPENREGTPEAMTYPLMEHQKLGLAWLKKMEDSEQKGGILADDMGLGKTIQALALMVSRRSEDPLCKTTLIVAPVALMKQWEREISIKLKAGRHSLKTFVLHGNNRVQPWERLRTYDVVLTTFGTLASEYKRRECIEVKKRANPDWRPMSKDDHLSMLGDHCFWFRVIIDEAQCIKNKSTKAALAASTLRAKSRFCMTGTPMMNSIDELYSLLRFLKVQPWMDSQRFNRHFSKPLKGHSTTAKDQAMRKLQVLLKAILLRRTKTSMIDGHPILNLPRRNTESRHAMFSDDEREFYNALESRTRLQFNKYLKAGTVGRNYSNILVLLLRLRQACCHPYLLRDFAEKGCGGELSTEAMVALAKDLAPGAVPRLIEQTNSNEEAALECPICMDMTSNATIFIPCGHNTCSECFARITDPAQAIANGDAPESRNGEAKCPNCREKVLPSKIIDHNTFKKVHMPGTTEDNLNEDEVAGSDDETTGDSDDSEDESDNESHADIDVNGNLEDFVVDDDATTDEESGYRQGATPFEKASKKFKKTKGKGKAKAKAKADEAPRRTLAQLKKDSSSSAKARRRYLKRLEKDWETSAKIEKTLEILRNIQSAPNPETKRLEKVIIFSQFTSLLDLLEVPIDRAGWGYRRYDGSMNPKARDQAVETFSDDKDCTIMLISLKAGNSGLNLTAASQVIIFDPFWNPYIEEQAIDRAHRIGQMNPVHVHRILVPKTVEDRILALQEKKRRLIESALDEGESRRIGRLSTADMAFLFDVPLTH